MRAEQVRKFISIVALATNLALQPIAVPLAAFAEEGTPPNAAPVANANGPYAGETGSPISFSSAGSSDPEGPITYEWDFAYDGVTFAPTSTEPNPTYTYYGAAGSYTAALRVTDNAGASSLATASVSVTPPPNKLPTAEANGPYLGKPGSPLTFSSNGSSDPDGTIVKYQWDYTYDGATFNVEGTGVGPSYTYQKSGSYTVGLKVVDDRGGESAMDTAAVTVNAPPIMDSIELEPIPAYTNDELDGKARSHDPEGNSITLKRQWKKNGVPIPGATNRHLDLSVPGNGDPGDVLTVTITACDQYACGTPKTSDPLTVSNYNPTAEANGPYSGVANTPITFSSTGSSDSDGTIARYEWDFDYNGTTFTVDAIDANPSHTYTSGGTFTAGLRVIDNNGGVSSVDTAQVKVNGPPTVQGFHFDPAVAYLNTTLQGVVVANDAEGDPVTLTYQWKKSGVVMPDAIGASLDLSAANEAKGDTLSLTVTACDPYNCATPWVSPDITITNAAPQAHAGGPYVGWPGKTPTFSAGGSTDVDGAIVRYEWDLNYDGKNFDVDASTLDVTPPYGEPGTYQVALRVVDNDGVVSPVRTTTCTICEEKDCKKSILIENNNNANVSNTLTVDSTTGGNAAEGGTGGSSADDGNGGNGGAASITTGDAKGSGFLENILNTNIIGTNWQEILIDVYDKFQGDVNLYQKLGNLLDGTDDAGKTLLAITNENIANVTNLLTLLVSSGKNTAKGGAGGVVGDDGAAGNGGAASITTGDAMAVANLLNFINSNIVGANFLLSIMNIFGEWVGDLILPGDGVFENGMWSGGDLLEVSNDNVLELENDIGANADTGGNQASGGDGQEGANGGNASVKTGKAKSISRILNLVNTNITGGNYLALLPNILGNWEGTVIDGEGQGDFWINLVPGEGSGFKVVVSNKNTAKVKNIIKVDALTGGNTALGGLGGGSAAITTGNAKVIANILNLVNTNITGGNFIFAAVNLFGTWRGNIIFAYPDLAVAVEDGVDTAKPGDTLTYTIAYGNGGKARSKDTAVSQILPPGLTYVSNTSGTTPTAAGNTLTWVLPGQASGEIASFTVTTAAGSDFPEGNTNLDTSVTVATTTTEKHKENNSAGDRTVIQFRQANASSGSGSGGGPETSSATPQLALTKSNDAPGPVTPGSTVNFTVTVENTGSAAMVNLEISDVFRDPNGKEIARNIWQVGAIEPGEKYEVSYSVKVPDTARAGTYTNTASAQGTNADSQVTVASTVASSPVSVDPQGTPYGIAPGEGDGEPRTEERTAGLTISKTNNLSGPIPPGTSVSYTITVKNTGTVPLSDVIVYDKLVNGFSDIVEATALNDNDNAKVTTWKLGTIASGVGIRITYQLAISTAAPPGMYTNTTWAEGKDESDQAVRSNTASSTIEVLALPGVNVSPSILGASTALAAGDAFFAPLGGDEPSFPERLLGVDAPCQGWPIAVWMILLFFYIMLLVWFYFFDGDRFRILFPTALTVVALGLYLIYACPGSIIWWPLAVLGSGIILSILAALFPHTTKGKMDSPTAA